MFTSLLAPSAERRSRSKSPGGRDRDRSRSRDGRAEEVERSRRKPSKRHSDSDTDHGRGGRSPVYQDVNPPKKYYDSSSGDERRKPKSSARPANGFVEDDGKSRKSRESVVVNGDHALYADAVPNATYKSQTIQPTQRSRATSSAGPQYAEVGKVQYAQPDRNFKYKYKDSSEDVRQPPVAPYHARAASYGGSAVADVKPGRTERTASGKTEKAYVDDRYKRRTEEPPRKVKDHWDDPPTKLSKSEKQRRGSFTRERTPRGSMVSQTSLLDDSGKNLAHLSVAGALGGASLAVAGPHGLTGGKPPASPLLEAYKGTYQTISPMPSPLALVGSRNEHDLSDLDLDSDLDLEADPLKQKIQQLEKEKKKHQQQRAKGKVAPVDGQMYETREPGQPLRSSFPSDLSLASMSPTAAKKKVSFYDPEDDAAEIAAALQGSHRAPNVRPLLKILPGLTPDDLDALKAEYKRHAKIGGQGINMSKHIKARVTGNLGKVCYATSLGQYESDAYWANCFYQSGASRRELLIESLVGRSNQQIREIKNFFKDKRYDDDLEKCMKAELKADKFRTAILLALSEERMPESTSIDFRLVKHDVIDLYEALNSPGGETAMIEIILVRSDAHLREVLRMYEDMYDRNFARDMIDKSRNLVGETLAHLLNGALNRGMRDAILLHQAIAETAPGKERAELLISRIVRLHWEPRHLERVKMQYHQRYGIPVEAALQQEVQAHMKTDDGRMWVQFCIELIDNDV